MVLVEKENEVPPESAMPNRAYLQLWHSTRVCAVADTQALHTPSALRLRALLRNHPIVVQALEAWWMAALHTMRGASRLDMSTYVLISKNLYKAVVEEWDEEDATENAFSEWNDEAAIKAGATTLSPSDFMDGMFELADIHTEHIDWEEYSTFLSNLLLKVTIEDPPGSGRRLFCPVGSVDHMVSASPHKRQVDENAPPSSPLRGAKRFGAESSPATRQSNRVPPPVKPRPPPQVTAKSRRPVGREFTNSIGMLTGGKRPLPTDPLSGTAPPIKPFEDATPSPRVAASLAQRRCHILGPTGRVTQTDRIDLMIKPEGLALLENARKAGERAAAATGGAIRAAVAADRPQRPVSALTQGAGRSPRAAATTRRPSTAPAPESKQSRDTPTLLAQPAHLIWQRGARAHHVRARLGPAVAGARMLPPRAAVKPTSEDRHSLPPLSRATLLQPQPPCPAPGQG